jgi:hypothetical protein
MEDIRALEEAVRKKDLHTLGYLSYSCGHAKPASLLVGEEIFLASNRLQIRIRSPPKGLKPVKSHFLGAFLGAAKF